MSQEDPTLTLLRPLWRAVHALGAQWLERDQRAALGPQIFAEASRFTRAVTEAALTRPGLAEEAAALRARQDRAQTFLRLRDHFARLERLCADSYLSHQTTAISEADALLARLRQGPPSPSLFDAIMFHARRHEQKRQAGLRGRRARLTQRTARRSDRAALQGALQSLWKHLHGPGPN